MGAHHAAVGFAAKASVFSQCQQALSVGFRFAPILALLRVAKEPLVGRDRIGRDGSAHHVAVVWQGLGHLPREARRFRRLELRHGRKVPVWEALNVLAKCFQCGRVLRLGVLVVGRHVGHGIELASADSRRGHALNPFEVVVDAVGVVVHGAGHGYRLAGLGRAWVVAHHRLECRDRLVELAVVSACQRDVQRGTTGLLGVGLAANVAGKGVFSVGVAPGAEQGLCPLKEGVVGSLRTRLLNSG